MTIAITWSLVATYNWPDASSAGIANIGGRLVMVAGSTLAPIRGAVYYSDDHGLTWQVGSDLAIFSGEGVGSSPSDLPCGLLCYEPGKWLHSEDGYDGNSGDGGGILRHHFKQTDPGMPVFNLTGFALFGRPCLMKRKDTTLREAGLKFSIWPGGFLYSFFGTHPVGPLLLELTASGSTTLTTAFMRHQLDPTGVPYATVNADGSISWLWVTFPPRVGSSTGVPEAMYTDGDFFFMLAAYDGIIHRPHGDNQGRLNGRNVGGSSYNYFTDAFFLRDGTLLLGCNVSGLSPCIWRSTARGMPGTLTEIVMPGNYFNYVPQGAKGSFLFSGLFVMTHCFCELDDGTVLCGGGAPTMTVPGEGSGIPVGSHASGTGAYHTPQVWKSTNKGVTWENISDGVADFTARQAPESLEAWEARILLALGGQAAFMACAVDLEVGFDEPDWTPFFVSQDGVTFEKSPVPREGFMAPSGSGSGADAFFYPQQATFANDGSILVVLMDWTDRVEIWRGSLTGGLGSDRAVGFLKNSTLLQEFNLASIPERELIRG